MKYPDQSVIPISLSDIPIDGRVNHIDNTGNIIKDGYYYDSNTEEYYHYVTNPLWIREVR